MEHLKRNHPCIDCGTMITKHATRCISCHNSWHNQKESNGRWSGGKEIPCIQCGKLVWRRPSDLKSRKDPTIKARIFCSNKCRGIWQRDNCDYDKEAMKVKDANTLKEKWENEPEYVQKTIKSWHLRPTVPEQKLVDILVELKLTYKYVGDGEFTIGRKCPDFVNVNGQKKVIEMYGDFWHKGENPQDRIDLFATYGFDTLIVWQKELKNPELVKERLLTFNTREVKNDSR